MLQRKTEKLFLIFQVTSILPSSSGMKYHFDDVVLHAFLTNRLSSLIRATLTVPMLDLDFLTVQFYHSHPPQENTVYRHAN